MSEVDMSRKAVEQLARELEAGYANGVLDSARLIRRRSGRGRHSR
jgi:hypothetical protein